jgi:hypothetical protein
MSTRQPAAGFPGLRQPIACAFLVSVLTCLLTGVHLFFYSRLVGLVLYRLAGGIHYSDGGWTRFGGAPFAWTIPLQLPGTLVLAFQQPGANIHIAGIAGVTLLIVASLATAYSFASILGGWIRGKGFCWGRFGWKGLMIALGIVWIPVPEQWALVYYYTVKY